jgi:GDPmannose 4,6-dehydratase
MTPEFYGKKRALITGGAGQDGWYLIELLLSRGR